MRDRDRTGQPDPVIRPPEHLARGIQPSRIHLEKDRVAVPRAHAARHFIRLRQMDVLAPSGQETVPKDPFEMPTGGPVQEPIGRGHRVELEVHAD